MLSSITTLKLSHICIFCHRNLSFFLSSLFIILIISFPPLLCSYVTISVIRKVKWKQNRQLRIGNSLEEPRYLSHSGISTPFVSQITDNAKHLQWYFYDQSNRFEINIQGLLKLILGLIWIWYNPGKQTLQKLNQTEPLSRNVLSVYNFQQHRLHVFPVIKVFKFVKRRYHIKFSNLQHLKPEVVKFDKIWFHEIR